ncbi:MAG TPA: hypothetical protein VIA62_24595 [Thermoanaerobaculia bacterium]|nr:hypothetical protein [Thermoanaerobaculia bacterium]
MTRHELFAGQLQRRWEVMRSNVRAIHPYVPGGPLPLARAR